MAAHVDALLADAPRRSVLFCDTSKEGDDGGCVGHPAAPLAGCSAHHGCCAAVVLASPDLVAGQLTPCPTPTPTPSACSEDLRRAAANLPWVDCIPQLGLNVYSILQVTQGGGGGQACRCAAWLVGQLAALAVLARWGAWGARPCSRCSAHWS